MQPFAMPPYATPNDPISIPAVLRNANSSPPDFRAPGTAAGVISIPSYLPSARTAAQPVHEPHPEEAPDIEWRGGGCPGVRSRKPRIELGGEFGNQPATKLEDGARARELGERALQAVFDRHENSGLLPVGLRH